MRLLFLNTQQLPDRSSILLLHCLSSTLLQNLWQQTDSFEDIFEVWEDGRAAQGMRERKRTWVIEALSQCIEQEHQNIQLFHQCIYDKISTLCSAKEKEN